MDPEKKLYGHHGGQLECCKCHKRGHADGLDTHFVFCFNDDQWLCKGCVPLHTPKDYSGKRGHISIKEPGTESSEEEDMGESGQQV